MSGTHFDGIISSTSLTLSPSTALVSLVSPVYTFLPRHHRHRHVLVLPRLFPSLSRKQALVVTYSNQEVSRQAVERLHLAFPRTPIFARATDYEQYLALQDFGATAVVSDLRLGCLRSM